MRSSVIVLLLLSVLLIASAKHVQLKGKLRNGEIVVFRNLGHIKNAQHKFLDGQTVDGKTQLAPNTENQYTGTHWKVHQHRDGSYSFECLGHLKNAQHRFLDGRTVDGTVGLAPNTKAPWTGTRWHVVAHADGSYTFKCLGNIKNAQHLFLDGRTVDGSLGLAPNTKAPWTGTHWRVFKLENAHHVKVHHGHHHAKPHHAHHVKIHLGHKHAHPHGHVHHPHGKVHHHHVKHVNGLLRNGEIVSLKCLGTNHQAAHQFLNFHKDHVAHLTSANGVQHPHTHWKVVAHKDGSYSFEAVAKQGHFLEVLSDHNALRGSHDYFAGARWNLHRHHNGSFSLKYVRANAHCGAGFLDGRTADGTIGLAPNTKAPWTGTHWEIRKI